MMKMWWKLIEHIILSVQSWCKERSLHHAFNILQETYMGVSEVADYESIIRFSKFKMADQIWRTKIRKISELDKNWYTGVFQVSLTSKIPVYRFSSNSETSSFRPPYWIRHPEFWKSDDGFVISDIGNSRIGIYGC